jgi:hypothetical protein
MQTGRGCALLASKGFDVEIAAAVGVREADDRIVELLPRGARPEFGTFRRATFIVTDCNAPEAIFDIGVRMTSHSANAPIGGFVSLRAFFVPVQNISGNGAAQGYGILGDNVCMHIGLEENLTLQLDFEAWNKGTRSQGFVEGVPLGIRLRGT